MKPTGWIETPGPPSIVDHRVSHLERRWLTHPLWDIAPTRIREDNEQPYSRRFADLLEVFFYGGKPDLRPFRSVR